MRETVINNIHKVFRSLSALWQMQPHIDTTNRWITSFSTSEAQFEAVLKWSNVAEYHVEVLEEVVGEAGNFEKIGSCGERDISVKRRFWRDWSHLQSKVSRQGLKEDVHEGKAHHESSRTLGRCDQEIGL